MIEEKDVERALDFIRDNAAKAAWARANRIYVEEYRKTIKAKLMKEYANLPIGAQEREAYADDRYVNHLMAIREAVEQDEEIRFMIAAAEAKIEAWRTQSSNNRKGF